MRLLSSSEVKNKKQKDQEKMIILSINLSEIIQKEIKKLQELEEKMDKNHAERLKEINEFISNLEQKKLALQIEINALEKLK